MVTRVVSALQAASGIDEWVVRVQHRRSAQLFLIGDRVECRRRVVTEQIEAEVFVDHDGGRGTSSFVILPAEGDRLGEKIEQSLFMARLNKNPPFTLPRPAVYPAVEIADPQVMADADAVADEIGGKILRVLQSQEHTRPSSLEVFADDVTTDLHTSAGVQAQKHGTHLLLEMVILARQGDTEAERQVLREWRRADDLDVAAFIGEQVKLARDALAARLPRGGVFPIVVRGGDLPELLAPFLYHAAASTKFRKMNRFELGDRVTEGAGAATALEILSDATIPYGLRSEPFDDEGLPGTRVVLVRDGELKNLWATNRYAQYLGVPATGAVANLVVTPGAHSLEALLTDGPVIEVAAFSDLDPDPITGDFVGEIRLGYLHAGGHRRAIKGGSVSGNVFRAFGSAAFSQERAVHNSYHGPAAIRFAELQVAGE